LASADALARGAVRELFPQRASPQLVDLVAADEILVVEHLASDAHQSAGLAWAIQDEMAAEVSVAAQLQAPQ
jgi:hypothetical protein